MFKKRAGRSLRVRKNSSDEDEEDTQTSNRAFTGNSGVSKFNTARPTTISQPARLETGKAAMSFADDNSDDSDICENPDWFVRKKNIANERAAYQAQLKFKKRERNAAKKDITEVPNERKVFDILPKKADDKMNVKVGPLRKASDMPIKPEPSLQGPANEQCDIVLNKLGQGVIPNAAEIHAARKRRQVARDAVGVDYVPISTKGPTTSEIIREDFSSGDEEERMEMVGKRNDRMNQRITIQETIDDHNETKSNHSDDNSDNEMSKWEQEQLEKVIGKVSLKNLVEKSSSVLQQHQPQYHESHLNVYGNGYATVEANYANVVSSAYNQRANNDVTLPKLPEVDVNSFLESLKTKLQQLQTTHEKTADEMKSIVKQNIEAEMEITNAKETLPNLEQEFKFFQQLRNYVNDLTDCLNEKILVIEKVEQLIHQCYKRETEYLKDRREQELSDETTEMTMLASSDGFLNPATLVDSHNQRIMWRCGRRQRRRAYVLQNIYADNNSEKNINGNALLIELELFRKNNPDACDGLSSDEELDANFNETLLEEQKRILNEENFLFEDTVDEFKDLEIVMQKLEAWKLSYPQSYDNSFVSDNLPKLFSPFVRLEMLHWNPLKNPILPLSSFTWFRMLCLFGIRSDEILQSVNNFESDAVLVCRIIERVMIPKLVYFVENVWKVSSISQSKNLSFIIKDFLKNYPTLTPESKKVQKLVDAVMVRIEHSISDDIFIPLYSKSQIVSIPAMRTFLHRQFWTCFKVAYAISSFDGVITKTILVDRFCNGLLNRYLVMALTNLPLDELLILKLENLVSIVPESWLLNTESGTSSETPPEFGQFIRFISQMATDLAQKLPRSHFEINFCGRLLAVLSKLKSTEVVKHLINSYHLNQFLYLLK